jgi:hypothetical protein
MDDRTDARPLQECFDKKQKIRLLAELEDARAWLAG